MEINNFTKEQIYWIANNVCCPRGYGFDGAETFPTCGKCLICLCKKKIGVYE